MATNSKIGAGGSNSSLVSFGFNSCSLPVDVRAVCSSSFFLPSSRRTSQRNAAHNCLCPFGDLSLTSLRVWGRKCAPLGIPASGEELQRIGRATSGSLARSLGPQESSQGSLRLRGRLCEGAPAPARPLPGGCSQSVGGGSGDGRTRRRTMRKSLRGAYLSKCDARRWRRHTLLP